MALSQQSKWVSEPLNEGCIGRRACSRVTSGREERGVGGNEKNGAPSEDKEFIWSWWVVHPCVGAIIF
jgi:hypothetical protein